MDGENFQFLTEMAVNLRNGIRQTKGCYGTLTGSHRLPTDLCQTRWPSMTLKGRMQSVILIRQISITAWPKMNKLGTVTTWEGRVLGGQPHAIAYCTNVSHSFSAMAEFLLKMSVNVSVKYKKNLWNSAVVLAVMLLPQSVLNRCMWWGLPGRLSY